VIRLHINARHNKRTFRAKVAGVVKVAMLPAEAAAASKWQQQPYALWRFWW
jgi:hypothetical protein